MAKVLAHEFGHNLGLPDCQIEGLSADENVFFYFELDRKNKNLMCSIDFGEMIPSRIKNDFKNTYCQ